MKARHQTNKVSFTLLFRAAEKSLYITGLCKKGFIFTETQMEAELYWAESYMLGELERDSGLLKRQVRQLYNCCNNLST